tara:strand:+ start:229 stop:474 length:246 start_codon:yes stop_codon:yes gene_type:complete
MFKIIIMLKNLLGNKNGLLSLLSEKTGKISFKRSVGVIVLTTIVAPDVTENGLTILNVCLCVGVLLSVALPNIIKANKEDI